MDILLPICGLVGLSCWVIWEFSKHTKAQREWREADEKRRKESRVAFKAQNRARGKRLNQVARVKEILYKELDGSEAQRLALEMAESLEFSPREWADLYENFDAMGSSGREKLKQLAATKMIVEDDND